MTKRIKFASVLALWAWLTLGLACTTDSQPRVTTSHPSPTPPIPTVRRTPTLPASTASATMPTRTKPPLATVNASGPAVTDVGFALDVDQNGELIFPATEFVYGVTRVYARFAYERMQSVDEVKTVWYRNENPVSSGRLRWDGGEQGAYIIWVEDPHGLGRGEWRLELAVADTAIGSGQFTIGGSARYTDENWGISFDPPLNWEVVSETVDSVSFSSLDQRWALALRVVSDTMASSEVTVDEAPELAIDDADVEIVTTEEVTMNGERARLQQLSYQDHEDGEKQLFIVSTLHAGSAYSLWLLGPAEEETELKQQLAEVLYSIRFAPD